LACTVPAGLAEQTPCGLSAAAPLPDAGPGQTPAVPSCSEKPDASLCILGSGATAEYTPPPRLLGDNRTTQVLLSVAVADSSDGAEGCLYAAAANQDMPTEPDHCVLALKRLTVTDPTQPLSNGALPVLNHNPTLADFHFSVPDAGPTASLLDGTALFTPAPSSGAGVAELHAVRADDAAEVEPTFDDQGKVTGAQYEGLTVSYFTTAGSINGSRAAYTPPGCATQVDCPNQAPGLDAMTTWNAPTADELARQSTDGSVRLWAVIRDDRGGVSWAAGSAHTP
jgi:hypothetical protein